MNEIFRNKLAEKPTNWKIWYAIIPSIAMILASTILNMLTIVTGGSSVVIEIMPISQFIIMSVITFIAMRLLNKRKFNSSSLGFDTKTLKKRNIVIVVLVFVISHLIFDLLSKASGVNSDAKAEFINFGFGKSFTSDLTLIISGAICAPVFEELLYRGVLLRSVHDGTLKYFPNAKTIFSPPAILAIVVAAIFFIMPHVSHMKINVMTVAYFITSAGFSIVYLLTRSMTTAMVSHSLQSCLAFSKLLIYGHGEHQVSPIIFGIAFLCPIIVFFIGEGFKKYLIIIKNSHKVFKFTLWLFLTFPGNFCWVFFVYNC